MSHGPEQFDPAVVESWRRDPAVAPPSAALQAAVAATQGQPTPSPEIQMLRGAGVVSLLLTPSFGLLGLTGHLRADLVAQAEAVALPTAFLALASVLLGAGLVAPGLAPRATRIGLVLGAAATLAALVAPDGSVVPHPGGLVCGEVVLGAGLLFGAVAFALVRSHPFASRRGLPVGGIAGLSALAMVSMLCPDPTLSHTLPMHLLPALVLLGAAWLGFRLRGAD